MATAMDITIREALALLDGPLSALARGVAERRYAFWVGAGISRNRVEDVGKVVGRVLSHLQAHILDIANPNDPYKKAISEALDFAALSPADLASIDLAQPIASWPPINTVIRNLSGAYSKLLDIRVDGKPADYLLWEVVDVPNTFAPGVAEPDCEHLCLAMLVREGVLPEIVSANWDGLIEAALGEIAQVPDSLMQVCVHADDLQKAHLLTRLLKFHGCAVSAGKDEVRYRGLLIGSLSRITNWHNSADHKLMRHELVSLAATKRTLMLGMSAQDGNIQQIFADGDNLRNWGWPCDPPAHVFAEDVLGASQRNILRVVYSAEYEANRLDIEAGALFRAFAKPALTALVLHVICAKLCEYSRLVLSAGTTDADRNQLKNGLLFLRNQLADADDGDRFAFVQILLQANGHCASLFQTGSRAAGGATDSYRPISIQSIEQIVNDPNLNIIGMREMASALGLLGLGASDGRWSIHAADIANPKGGVLSVETAAGEMRVFFSATREASVQLEINGIVNSSDADAIVLHSQKSVKPMTRSPRAAPGRTGRVGLRHVEISEIFFESPDFATVQTRFREECFI